MSGKLEKYRNKRDFSKTPEPSGDKEGKTRNPRFVIQEHHATRLHYDFRLEIDGVLKSWAVPKGPSLNPGDQRLAVETEDHPMDYRRFEGVIPEQEYGGGTVVVWDEGTFKNETQKNRKKISLEDAWKHGHLKIRLRGKKLKGAFSLRRFRNEKSPQWLLIKSDDEYADRRKNPVRTQPESVLSGRTWKEVRKDAGNQGKRQER